MSEVFTYAYAKATDTEINYVQNIELKKKTIQADASSELGGQDLFPKPSEYLAASLASCTTITLKMYLNVKKWNVQYLAVEVSHFKTQDKKTEWIERVLHVRSELEKEQLERLVDISNKCPIHKLLEKGIEIRTRLG